MCKLRKVDLRSADLHRLRGASGSGNGLLIDLRGSAAQTPLARIFRAAPAIRHCGAADGGTGCTEPAPSLCAALRPMRGKKKRPADSEAFPLSVRDAPTESRLMLCPICDCI